MKIFVVFGSKSDETVAIPLVQALSKDFEVEYEVISAHRDLEKLQHKMTTWAGDAVIAGAGLAAALPGVVAAMVRLPVFGIPVNSQFGGLDSLGSIAQMPPGVPVITCGPDKFSAIVDFLKHYKKQKLAGITKVHFVTSSADAAPEIEKAKKLGDEKGLAITSSAQKSADAFNVYLVTDENEIHTDEYCLHLPFFTKEEVNKPETYLTVLKWANKGGLWVGANNTRNAVQSALRLASSLPAMLYEGSVKNVRGVKGQSPYVFEFSDRYSIFDWGQMPDQLSGKGESLAFMGNFFFDFLGKAENWKSWKAPAQFEKSPALETLRKQGAFHHGLGLLGSNARCLAVKPVNVITPTSSSEGGKLHWNYTAYKQKPENALVPLEVIFRFGVPEGSSLLKRTSDAAYCKAIGLTTAPKSGDRFDIPVVEYSTKLETSDRYISYAEAQNIAGLSAEEFEEITTLSKLLALRLKDCFAGIGLELWDGKFEFGFTGKDSAGKRGFMLVDSIGPDELRLTRDDVHLSKEALRGYYRHSPWYAGLEKAKDLADQRGSKEWKEICINELKLQPPPLSQSVKEQVEMVYKGIVKALSEKYCAKVTYPDAWSLDEVVKGLKGKKKGSRVTEAVKTILLLGSGGREHALAWKMAQSPTVTKIWVLPGSDGIATVEKVSCLSGNAADPVFVVKIAQQLKPDLIFIGPETPLEAGVVDALEAAGFSVVGPRKAAAQLESSKIFSKEFMNEFGIPTAPFKVANTYDAAVVLCQKWDIEGKGIVIKADGLAAGKGVVVTHDRAEALKTLHDFMVNPDCSVKTDRLLLEEKITGKEVSAFALCDGKTFLPLGYACDYKRVNDNDQGPNTGGMGGYAPKGWPSDKARQFIQEHVFRPVMDGMQKRSTPFKGILFAGLMIDGDNVQVIEFNARFGDPETQILLPLVAEDIVPLFAQAAAGKLGTTSPALKKDHALHVVLTSGGYPETLGTGMRLGEKMDIPVAADNTLLFISGAKKLDNQWVNSGGRVIGVTALGATIDEARMRAYAAVEKIRFQGAHWRKDIGK